MTASHDRSRAARPRVVIVGAGFAGLNAARALRRAPVEVVLVDRNNYHKFQPLLYQVATSGLEADDVAHAVRNMFRGQRNFRFRLGTVQTIDRARRVLRFQSGPPEPYDYLVLGTGTVTNYFGVEGAREHAFPLKNLPDAIRLRNHILRQFELYDRDPAAAGAAALNFVIVGGGPTGIETAGALVELFERALQHDFARWDTTRAQVYLLEMQPELLASYAPGLQQYTRRVLEQRGVRVCTGTTVTRVTPEAVYLRSGDRSGDAIPTRTLIWAAGVRTNPLADLLGVAQGPGGRILVDADLRVPGHPELFVVGDMAAARGRDGALYPQLAPVAMQQGRHAAEQIQRLLAGRPTQPYVYRDPGKLATIGRNAAVAEFPGGLRFKGFTAWFLWVVIHIAKLIGFRNRAVVFVNWIHNYFTYDRHARLILDTVFIPDELPRDNAELEQQVKEQVAQLMD